MLMVTQDLATKIFHRLNMRYFLARLFVHDFDISYMDTELGYCVREEDQYIIGLTDEFEDEQQFISTLFHEMVHLYQYQHLNREPDHDYTFFVWEPLAKTTGLDFGIYG